MTSTPTPCRARPGSPRRRGAIALGCLLALAWSSAPARGAEVSPTELVNRGCLECHGQAGIAKRSPEERRTQVKPSATQPASPPKTRPGLYVLPGTFEGGPHAKLACTDCHEKTPNMHDQWLPKPRCGTACHVKAQSDYARSSHAAAAARGDEKAPTCISCHGGHDMRWRVDPQTRKVDRSNRLFPLNSAKACGDCHAQLQALTPGGHDGKAYVKGYFDSVHGRAVAKKGLVVAATCGSCHDSHKVLPEADKDSSVSRGHVAATCGTCHPGMEDKYLTSIHGRLAVKGDPKAPVCTSCHSGHRIARTDVPAFLQEIVDECGQCHNQPPAGSKGKATLYETYRRSYHGQSTRLGSTRAARCSSCHGSHDVQRIQDPDSALNAANRLGTCRKCHPDAGPMFAQFQPHADFRDAQRYPLLHAIWWYFIIMMSSAFGFFGLHSLLWLTRSIVERIRHGPHPRHVAETHAIQRFNRVDRLNHFFVIVSFFGLTLTGLPLLYAEQAWGRALANTLGGHQAAGLLHRFFALMLIGNFVVHFVGIFRRFRKHGVRKLLFGPATMLPRWKDVTDCLNMFRWFARGGQKPPFDRWTYWEKFDYMAEVGGSMIIGITGLLLWFPQFFSYIVPGWMFNVATMIHGYEALLAIGFIFTIHFYNAHLRLEKFPVDDVIFTGRLSEDEFRAERGAEYDRLQATGELDKLRVNVPARSYHVLAIIVGVLAMAVGMTLVVLIVLAGLGII